MSRQSKQAAEQPGFPKGESPIDRAHLERATFGDRALRDEVLALFLRQSAALAADIANEGDAAARSRAAHKLKGAALGIGALAVADAAAVFEPAPADPAALAEALARLAARIAAARAAIESLLSGH